jgi:hypothetical protein
LGQKFGQTTNEMSLRAFLKFSEAELQEISPKSDEIASPAKEQQARDDRHFENARNLVRNCRNCLDSLSPS